MEFLSDENNAKFVALSNDSEVSAGEHQEESEAQSKLAEILAQDPTTIQGMETIAYKSNRTEQYQNLESNFAFLHLIKPQFEGKKVLDLFCGVNPFKQFSERYHTGTQVTGVDISDPRADIQCDVANLPSVLPPENQFDILTSFGAHAGFEKFKDDYEYLKKDGIYIQGLSKDWYDEVVKEKFETNLDTITDPDLQELLRNFQPIAKVEVNGIHTIADWDNGDNRIELDSDMVYLIFKKHQLVKQV